MITTRFIVLVLAVGLLGCSKKSPSEVPIIPAKEALAGFHSDLITALRNLQPDAKDEKAVEQSLRAELSKIIDQYGPSLRPKSGSQKYFSSDESFVLVIGANGLDGKAGVKATGSDGQARLVVVVGGDGGVGRSGKAAGAGGSANAKSPNGIAVALGGRGGNGGQGSGGGGGGGAGNCSGSVGSVSLGGQGGKGYGGGGDGGTGSGNGIINPKAIVELVNLSNIKEGA